MLVALIVFNVVLGREVLKPLKRLASAIEQVQRADFVPQDLPREGSDEIGHLMRHFQEMATRFWVSRNKLEARVTERTAALEQSEMRLRHIAKPYSLAGKVFHISCSIGVPLYPEHALEEIALSHYADGAMYLAKQMGRNRVVLYQAAD